MAVILVAYASRHGATAEIAEAIGRGLREAGLEADVLEASTVADVSRYEAVVLGSAVYVGRWLDAARELAEANAEALAARPVWLFSSGPIGDPAKPEEGDAVQVGDLLERTRARGHRLFAGKLDKSRLGLGERAVVLAFRAPEGDFRDWDAIAAWAEEIADALRS